MKKLVIIGGGFAGSYIAKSLENKFETTLIDTKDYFEFTPGILRTIIEPKHMNKIQVLHKDYLHNSKIIIEKVTKVAKNNIAINGKNVSFDYLVICSGSSYNLPIKENVVIATRAHHLKEYHLKLERSNKVLIIGGGLVGVELAAEIATFYPNKEITLVHSHEKLMPRENEKAIRMAEKFLTKKGVKIIYNEKVIKEDGGDYITDKKKRIKSDLTFLCTGIKPNSDFMKNNFKSLLNKNGFVKVNKYLQIEGYNNIFSPGDINDISIEKTAQNTIDQSKIVVKNLLSMQNKLKLVKYKTKQTPIVISLGKHNGIFTYGKITFSGIIPAIIKSFIEKFEVFRLKI